MEEALFIGSSKVSACDQDTETGLVKVILEDPQGIPPILYFTVSQFEAVKSTDPYPDGEITPRKWTATVNRVIQIFLEENMELGDRSYVIDRIDEAIKSLWMKGASKKFGVPFMDKVRLQTLMDLVKSE